MNGVIGFQRHKGASCFNCKYRYLENHPECKMCTENRNDTQYHWTPIFAEGFPWTKEVNDKVFKQYSVVYSTVAAFNDDDMQAYRKSAKRLEHCRVDIDNLVDKYYKDNCLDGDAVLREAIKEHGIERVAIVLAHSVEDSDGRFNAGSKEWAKLIKMPDKRATPCKLHAHPGLINLLVLRFVTDVYEKEFYYFSKQEDCNE